MREVRSQDGSRASAHRPEVFIFLGPVGEGDTGDGSLSALYGHTWAGVWELGDDPVSFFRVVNDAWQEQTLIQALTIPKRARRPSAVCDQAGRVVLAYELDGEVYVRQYDSGSATYVLRGPFPGVDPCLFNDAVASRKVAGSDVVLWYLSADRTKLHSRVQRETYSTERIHRTFTGAQHLDQTTTLTYAYQIVGGPYDENKTENAWGHVGLYPVIVTSELDASAGPLRGVNYIPVVKPTDPVTSEMDVTAGPLRAVDYIPVVKVRGVVDTSEMDVSAGPLRGVSYIPVVIVLDVVDTSELDVGAGPLRGVDYQQIVSVIDPLHSELDVSAGPLRGVSYAAV